MAVTTRANQLQKLAMQLPQQNAQAAKGQQAARAIQLQEQIRQAGPSTNITPASQSVAAQQTGAAGNIQLQSQQQTQQQLGQVAGLGLQQQQQANQAQQFNNNITLSSQQRSAANQLEGINRNLRNKLLDQQLTFKTDRAGQALMNDRQLADWALTKAKSVEEYNDYAQAAQQVYEREIQILEAAHRKITQTLQQGAAKEGKQLDQALRKKLNIQKLAMEEEIDKKKNEAANKAAIWKSGGTILGAAVGGVIGSIVPGAGTVAGAAAGGALGGGLGSIFSGIKL